MGPCKLPAWQQPEVVVNLAEPIQVRLNWDFDMEWTIEN